MKGTVDYIWVIEPHKSGFIHMHMMIFATFTEDEKERLLSLWCDKYEAGVREAQDIQDVEIDHVNHIRTYLFKYLSKTWEADTMEDENLLTFNSTLWAMSRHESSWKGMRPYGSSERLSRVMKLDKHVSDEEWETVKTMIEDNVIFENKELSEGLKTLSETLDYNSVECLINAIVPAKGFVIKLWHLIPHLILLLNSHQMI